MKSKARVLIAGIGGASLGTEILKCLKNAGGYTVFGCDISEYAYGHYEEGFTETFLIDPKKYIKSIHQLCVEHGIEAIIPGGEEPLALLGAVAANFEKDGIHVAANSSDVIATCSDKKRLFEQLRDLGLPIPETIAITDESQIDGLALPCPCVIKPATGTGGSSFVFLASTRNETKEYLSYILKYRDTALVQEYTPLDEGEFTIGVLSLPDGRLVGSIAMQRLLNSKLSVLVKSSTGTISTGYSQGLIEDFPIVREQAEHIAKVIGSVGPINIQGRVRKGILLPFEINPRFSASTYLRAMAGFNEIDIYLRYVLHGQEQADFQVKSGYYLRSLSERFVGLEDIKR